MDTLKFKLFVFVVALSMSLVSVSTTAQAQGDDLAACQELVSTVILNLDAACGALERNAACYGNNRVDATFWEARADLLFGSPADRVPLVDLASIATAPLDVTADLWGIATIHAQVDLPDTLPGQAVTFMLMGDATVENRVLPAEAAVQTVTVPATTNSPANLRSRPSTQANVPLSVAAGTPLALLGMTEDGAWLQVWDESLGKLWIFAELVTVDAPVQLDGLPLIQADAVHYGPMQAFYFTTGLGAPDCQEAPNALVVQNPTLADITLNINELDVTIGSTVVFTMTTLSHEQRALVMVLVEGHLQTTVNGIPVRLTAAGDVLALTVSTDGLVGDATTIIALDDPAVVASVAQTAVNAAQNAEAARVFGETVLPPGGAAALTEQALTFFEPLLINVALPDLPDPANLPGVADVEDVVNQVMPLVDPASLTGQWGGCGSCDSCGFYANQCMRAPDGTCIWNPGVCQAGPNQPSTGSVVGDALNGIAGVDSGTVNDVIDTINDVVDDLGGGDLPDLPGW